MMSLSVLVARATVGLLDRLKLRIALVLHLGRLHQLLVDARRLRDLRQQHRLGGLIGCLAPTRARATAGARSESS